MWLDAFIKPNSANMQKPRVGRVDGVETARNANEYKGLQKTTPENSAVSMRVDGVEEIMRPTRPTPTDTTTFLTCLYDAIARKPNEYKGLAIRPTRPTRPTPQKHNAREITENSKEALEQFRFDLVQQEIDAGHSADELNRVNNIAWRLMTARGFSFNEAINEAAKWVVHNPAHRDEAVFVDVMKLFKGVMQ